MSKFTKDLLLKKLNKNKWEVADTFEYEVGSEDSGEKIIVPVGFNTDLASVPWAFRQLIPQDGQYTKAAVVHDYLYYTKGYEGKYTKKQCDAIFLEAMEVLGVPLWKRKVMHRAVRLAIWNDWSKV